MRIVNEVKKITLKETVDFGNYLLSNERKERFSAISLDRLEERLSEVTDADIRNFFGENAE